MDTHALAGDQPCSCLFSHQTRTLRAQQFGAHQFWPVRPIPTALWRAQSQKESWGALCLLQTLSPALHSFLQPDWAPSSSIFILSCIFSSVSGPGSELWCVGVMRHNEAFTAQTQNTQITPFQSPSSLMYSPSRMFPDKIQWKICRNSSWTLSDSWWKPPDLKCWLQPYGIFFSPCWM